MGQVCAKQWIVLTYTDGTTMSLDERGFLAVQDGAGLCEAVDLAVAAHAALARAHFPRVLVVVPETGRGNARLLAQVPAYRHARRDNRALL